MAKYGATTETPKPNVSGRSLAAAVIAAALVGFAVASVSGVEHSPTGALHLMGSRGPKKKIVTGITAPVTATANAMMPDAGLATGLATPTETKPTEPTVSAGWNEDGTTWTYSTDQPRKKEPTIEGPTLNGEPWSPPGKTRDACNFDGQWKSTNKFLGSDLTIDAGQVNVGGKIYPFTATGVTADGYCSCTLQLDAQKTATGFLYENNILWGPDMNGDVWVPQHSEDQDACNFDGKWKSFIKFVGSDLTIDAGQVNIGGKIYPFTATGRRDDGACTCTVQLDAQTTATGFQKTNGFLYWGPNLSADVWEHQN